MTSLKVEALLVVENGIDRDHGGLDSVSAGDRTKNLCQVVQNLARAQHPN